MSAEMPPGRATSALPLRGVPLHKGTSRRLQQTYLHDEPLQSSADVYTGAITGSLNEADINATTHSEDFEDATDSSSCNEVKRKVRHKPRTMIDWKSELCTYLNESPTTADAQILDKLDEAFAELRESRRQKLAGPKTGPPRFQRIYRIRCLDSRDKDYALYEEEPWVVESGPYLEHLRASRPISNLEVFLERNKDIAFIVYKDYECCRKRQYIQKSAQDRIGLAEAATWLKQESVTLISEALKDALEALAESAFGDVPYPNFTLHKSDSLLFPYLWWFHRRKAIAGARPRLNEKLRSFVDLFDQYIQETLAEDWKKVDDMVRRGNITEKYLSYLYVPGQLIILKPAGDDIAQLWAWELTDWLTLQPSQARDQAFGRVTARTWSFDGNFQQTSQELSLTANVSQLVEENEEFSVKNLDFYPISFASNHVLEALVKRGKMLWKCRHRYYIFHKGLTESDKQITTDSRFMIDMETYNQMHPREGAPYNKNELGPSKMRMDDPGLGDDFYMCLPPRVFGFNMQRKEWVNLEVHYFEDIQWNTAAFDLLVIDPKTKELIKAVVMNQLGSHASPDLIHGKGSGLFMLLHGSPGTGKTLTAESVAEIAQKPLYRVTCGDVGTRPEVVEQYLKTVLLLGKTWGCVVLLDEADVFLEQRSLVNLERNALVSVFLRVLEYYDGILILTSNRVGIFDEAFKSRIQLNLRYKTLEKHQRLQIWKNFIRHLDTLQKSVNAELTTGQPAVQKIGYGISIDEISAHVDSLAEADLNGREIRNVISTARQLALYRKVPVGVEHLHDVISEARKFDDYLKELKDGMTSDEIQRYKQAR